jgi:hypothetical protein
MSEFALQPTLAAADRHDFGTNSKVFHTNYFEQRATLELILDKLSVP